MVEEVGDGSLQVHVDDEVVAVSDVLDEVQLQVELDVDDDMLVGFQVHSVDVDVELVELDVVDVGVVADVLVVVDKVRVVVVLVAVEVMDDDDVEELPGTVMVVMDPVTTTAVEVEVRVDVTVAALSLRRRGHLPNLCKGRAICRMNGSPCCSSTFSSALPTSQIMTPPNHPFPGPYWSNRRPTISFTRVAGT